MFSGGIRVKVVSSGDFTVGERALVVVSPILSSSCCCWRGATPWELASFHHHSASRIFIMQPGCSPPPVVIQKDDYQPCGGEKQAGLRPPFCPQLQGCSSSVLGGGCVELGPRLHVGRGPLLPLVFGGEGRSLFMRRRRTSGTWGWLTAGVASHRVSDALVWMASVLPSAAWVGARLPIHRTRDGRTVCMSATPTASLASPVVLVGCTWRRTLRERRPCSRMSSLP